MVGFWLPEPPRGSDDSFHLNGVQVIAESDESDDEGFDHMGYVLLPPDGTQGLSNGNPDSVDNDSASESDEPEIPHLEQASSTIAATVDQTLVSFESSSSLRPDIEVDCDEVRAAMSNVTLPQSAFPSWATEIPETHWTSFLMARISNLQDDSGIK